MTTASATTTASHAAGNGGALTGAWTLFRFMLRRDRIRIPAWVAGLTMATVATALSFPGLYPEAADRQLMAATMENPAMVAMVGVNYSPDDYTFGVMMGHQMLWFTAVLVGLMSVLLVVRHTRAEEASGRAELVRSGVVGRHAVTTAALGVVATANVASAAFMTLGLGVLGIESIDWHGSLLYGLAHAAVGLVFAGVAAVTAQVTEHPRAAVGMGLAILGLAYVLRAVGDLTGTFLSWLSPIGWAQATEVYAANKWWPLLPAVAATVVLAGAAFSLSTKRDVGAGLRQPRPGPSGASNLLANPFGLALRLHRASVIGWSVATFLLGASYGSVLGEVEALLGNVNLGEMLPDITGVDIVELFASLVTRVMAILCSIYAVLAAQRMRSEETAGRAEPLLATALSRPRWMASHIAVAMGGGVVVLAAAGVGLGLAGAISTGDSFLLPRTVAASLAYAPALWVTAAVSVLFFGILPQLIAVVWAVVVYSFVVVYLGGLLGFPDWMMDLTPFAHVPQMPAEGFAIVPLLALTVVAAGLVAAGVAGFQRRDLQSTA